MANGQFAVADIPGAINRGLQFRQQEQLRPIQQQQAQQQVQLGQQQFERGGQQLELGQQKLQAGEQQALEAQRDSLIDQGLTLAAKLKSLPDNQKGAFLQGEIDQGRGNTDVQVLNGLVKANQFEDLNSALDQTISFGREIGRLKGAAAQPAGTREFENLISIVKGDPEGKTLEGKAAAVKLRLTAPASSSAAERIATDPVLTKAVAASGAEIAGAKESAKTEAELKQQLKFKPQITAAVKLAEKEASERGEVLTDLKRSEAALPGLLNAVGQLKDLAVIATSTFGGRLIDAAIKETGFGATKGATARTKFISIINNQVLPLLKPTFGAAFTVSEGESLKATMGDPNTSPEEKLAQLDAFIDQKVRDIETKQRQLGTTPPATQPPATQAADVDLSTLSLEELIALRDQG